MKCAKEGCSHKAAHQIGFQCYALGMPLTQKNKVDGKFNLAVCESHKNELTVADLVTAEGWNTIQQSMLSGGRALLDRNTLKLTYGRV